MRYKSLIKVSDPLSKLRQQFVTVMGAIITGTAIGGIAVQVVLALTTEDEFLVAAMLSSLFVAVVGGVVIILARQQRIVLASNIFVVIMTLATLTVPSVQIQALLAVVTILTVAALGALLPYLVVNLLVLLRLGYELFLVVQESGLEVTTQGTQIVVLMVMIVIVSVATRFFISAAEDSAIDSSRTSELLRATAQVGQVTTRLMSLDELFDRSVTLIQERFAFYHVQVFLLDEGGEYANLVASTGDAGRSLLARGHRLRVGSQSVIGRVCQVGEPVVARDTDRDSVHATNELLPNTRSELALPIIDGDEIIGALDVQSTRSNAFNEVDIQALQVMANMLAVSIRNSRLFESQRANIDENKRLFLQAEAERREIQRLNMALTKNAWESYLRDKQDVASIAISSKQGEIYDIDWSATMETAHKRQRPITSEERDETVIAVPIVLRNQVLGVIEVAAEDMNAADTVEILQSVSQRLATSLDNIRLFQEAQVATMQEQRINEIVTQYQVADTIDDLLRITLEELSRTFEAENSMIRLGLRQMDNVEDDFDQSNGHMSDGHTNDGHTSNGSSSDD